MSQGSSEPNRSLTYQSLVIRYWQESRPSGSAVQRCLLIDPQTGRRQGFDSFAQLGAYLAAGFGKNLGKNA